nr:ABC transporter permease [Pseudomonas luteola]
MRLKNNKISDLKQISRLHSQNTTEIIYEAFTSLKNLGHRSLIALLGIAVGSAAVVALLNIGHNATNEAISAFKGLGTNLIVVNYASAPSVTQPAPSTFDESALKGAVPGIESISPVIQTTSSIRNNGRGVQASVVGTNSALSKVVNIKLSIGRFLSPYDLSTSYAIVGSRIANELSVGYGDNIQIEGYLFEVIGIAEPQSFNALVPVDVNQSIFIPIGSLRRISSIREIGIIIVSTYDEKRSAITAKYIKDYFDAISGGRNVEVQIPKKILESLARQASVFSYLLTALGGISLLIGGIGVMNVMLMSITERRREIGIRMALGARPKDIRNLFLVEAVALSTTGALMGVCLGLILAYLFVRISSWAFSISLLSLPLGITSALVTGLFFGIYPAVSASRLQPIQALRDD